MWLGAALQVLGTIIAAVALVLEWRSESRIMARELKDDRERRCEPVEGDPQSSIPGPAIVGSDVSPAPEIRLLARPRRPGE